MLVSELRTSGSGCSTAKIAMLTKQFLMCIISSANMCLEKKEAD
jgi:hypothetical protein